MSAIFSKAFNTIESLAACYPISWGTAAITFLIMFHVIVGRMIKQYEPEAEKA